MQEKPSITFEVQDEEAMPLIHIEINYYSYMVASFEVYIGGESVIRQADVEDLNTAFLNAQTELQKYLTGIMKFPGMNINRPTNPEAVLATERAARGPMSGMEVIEEPVQEEVTSE